QLTHVKPIASERYWLQPKVMAKVMDKKIYGLLAEFDTTTQIVEAARRVREAGFTKTDAFSPFPIHEMDEALGIKRSILPYMVFGGGVAGLCAGLGLQYFVHVIDYPIIVGGRPFFSLPSFIPATFEMTILLAAFTAVLGMILLNGLPQPYHPVFNVPRFALATREKFFLLIETTDPKFKYEETKSFMQSLNPQEVFDVEP
ncbi:MAG TPA: DUF3341 domain-containing protein, partial [Pyrinomonadaceae bacterium]|nr:DUF3341 domain-containing protein [Pyrinomonadaceae bacterium]